MGASLIAHDFMVALKTLPENEHTVVAVSSRSLDRATEFAERHKIAKAYGSYEELAKDEDVEVVYVTTIHPQHASLCKLALSHGKHVLCEKPFTLNLKDTKELFDLAKIKGLFIMEALWTRFFPLYAEVKNLVDSNVLGEIRVVMVSFGVNLDHVERLQDPALGGGALLDLGIYCLTIVDMIFGGQEPVRISAAGQKTPAGVDSTVTITMLYTENRTASVTISMAAQLPNEAVFAGSKGSLTVHAPFHCATKFTSPAGTKEYPLPKPSMPLKFVNSTGMRYEIEAVRKSLLSSQTQNYTMPWSTTERIVGWMDEIRQQIGIVYKEDIHKDL